MTTSSCQTLNFNHHNIWMKQNPSSGHYWTLSYNNNRAVTWAERGHVVRGGEVKRGSCNVHHIVIIIVTRVMEAVKAPRAVAGVFHPFKACSQHNKQRQPLRFTRSQLREVYQLYLCGRRLHVSETSSPKTETLSAKDSKVRAASFTVKTPSNLFFPLQLHFIKQIQGSVGESLRNRRLGHPQLVLSPGPSQAAMTAHL